MVRGGCRLVTEFSSVFRSCATSGRAYSAWAYGQYGSVPRQRPECSRSHRCRYGRNPESDGVRQGGRGKQLMGGIWNTRGNTIKATLGGIQRTLAAEV